MKTTTWKTFKEAISNNNVSFCGATNKSIEELEILCDKNINSDFIYDRTAHIRSKHIEFIYNDIEGVEHSSRLDIRGTVYQHEGFFIVSDWNNMIYKIEGL